MQTPPRPGTRPRPPKLIRRATATFFFFRPFHVATHRYGFHTERAQEWKMMIMMMTVSPALLQSGPSATSRLVEALLPVALRQASVPNHQV